VVARRRDHPDLVLHLHHHDRVSRAVGFAQVLQQGCKGPRVAVAIRGRERREHLLRRAVEVDRAGEAPCVALDPRRRSTTCCSSGANDSSTRRIWSARLADQLVDRRELEAALVRLDQVLYTGARP
jgi:hypothetical protein